MAKQDQEPSNWFQQARSIFLAGINAAVPLVVTYFVFKWLFDAFDGIFQPIIIYLTGRVLPGAGLVALVLLVYLLGLVATNVVGRRLMNWLDYVIARVPLIGYIYGASAQVLNAVRSLRHVPYKKVVMVEFPKAGMYSIGFVTGKPVVFKGGPRIPLFIPHTPNPMTGFLVLLPPEDIIDTDLSIDDAMRMVLSGGLLYPDSIPGPSHD